MMATEQRETMIAHAVEHLEEHLTDGFGWQLSVMPERRHERAEWGLHMARLLAAYRADVWPMNPDLVVNRFGGDFLSARKQVEHRYRDPRPLATTLTGEGRTILASAFLIKPFDIRGKSIDDLGVSDIDAVQPISFDVSAAGLFSSAIRIVNDTIRARKINRGAFWYSLHGGVEPRLIPNAHNRDSRYRVLAYGALSHVDSQVPMTTYFGTNDTDQTALAIYRDMGFKWDGMPPVPDSTFGSVRRYKKAAHPN